MIYLSSRPSSLVAIGKGPSASRVSSSCCHWDSWRSPLRKDPCPEKNGPATGGWRRDGGPHRDRLSSLEDKLGTKLVDELLSKVHLSLQAPAAHGLVLHTHTQHTHTVRGGMAVRRW